MITPAPNEMCLGGTDNPNDTILHKKTFLSKELIVIDWTKSDLILRKGSENTYNVLTGVIHHDLEQQFKLILNDV